MKPICYNTGQYPYQSLYIGGEDDDTTALTRCANLDGVNEHLRETSGAGGVGDFTSSTTNNIMVGCWIKTPNAAADAVMVRGATSNPSPWHLFVTTGGVLFAEFRENGNTSGNRKQYRDSTDLRDDAWHFIGASFEGGAAGTAVMHIYLDGNRVASPTKTVDNNMSSIASLALNFNLGADNGANQFQGCLTGAFGAERTSGVFTEADWQEAWNGGSGIDVANVSWAGDLNFNFPFNQPGDDMTGTTGSIADVGGGGIALIPQFTEAGDLLADGPGA